MPKRKARPALIQIGTRKVSLLVAALIAQDSDRRGLRPDQVGDVDIPDPAPTTVVIAGFTLSLETGALLARRADEKGTRVDAQMSAILEEVTASL